MNAVKPFAMDWSNFGLTCSEPQPANWYIPPGSEPIQEDQSCASAMLESWENISPPSLLAKASHSEDELVVACVQKHQSHSISASESSGPLNVEDKLIMQLPLLVQNKSAIFSKRRNKSTSTSTKTVASIKVKEEHSARTNKQRVKKALPEKPTTSNKVSNKARSVVLEGQSEAANTSSNKVHSKKTLVDIHAKSRASLDKADSMKALTDHNAKANVPSKTKAEADVIKESSDKNEAASSSAQPRMKPNERASIPTEKRKVRRSTEELHQERVFVYQSIYPRLRDLKDLSSIQSFSRPELESVLYMNSKPLHSTGKKDNVVQAVQILFEQQQLMKPSELKVGVPQRNRHLDQRQVNQPNELQTAVPPPKKRPPTQKDKEVSYRQVHSRLLAVTDLSALMVEFKRYELRLVARLHGVVFGTRSKKQDYVDFVVKLIESKSLMQPDELDTDAPQPKKRKTNNALSTESITPSYSSVQLCITPAKDICDQSTESASKLSQQIKPQTDLGSLQPSAITHVSDSDIDSRSDSDSWASPIFPSSDSSTSPPVSPTYPSFDTSACESPNHVTSCFGHTHDLGDVRSDLPCVDVVSKPHSYSDQVHQASPAPSRSVKEATKLATTNCLSVVQLQSSMKVAFQAETYSIWLSDNHASFAKLRALTPEKEVSALCANSRLLDISGFVEATVKRIDRTSDQLIVLLDVRPSKTKSRVRNSGPKDTPPTVISVCALLSKGKIPFLMDYKVFADALKKQWTVGDFFKVQTIQNNERFGRLVDPSEFEVLDEDSLPVLWYRQQFDFGQPVHVIDVTSQKPDCVHRLHMRAVDDDDMRFPWNYLPSPVRHAHRGEDSELVQLLTSYFWYDLISHFGVAKSLTDFSSRPIVHLLHSFSELCCTVSTGLADDWDEFIAIFEPIVSRARDEASYSSSPAAIAVSTVLAKVETLITGWTEQGQIPEGREDMRLELREALTHMLQGA